LFVSNAPESRRAICLLTPTLAVSKIGETRENTMSRKPIPQRALFFMTAVGLVLPIALAVVLGAASLLAAMADPAGAAALRWVGFGLGVVWVVDLVSLVMAQALNWLSDQNGGHDPRGGSQGD